MTCGSVSRRIFNFATSPMINLFIYRYCNSIIQYERQFQVTILFICSKESNTKLIKYSDHEITCHLQYIGHEENLFEISREKFHNYDFIYYLEK